MSTSEIFLIGMIIIFTVPYLFWRLGRTEYYAPLVVVQIIGGILRGDRSADPRPLHGKARDFAPADWPTHSALRQPRRYRDLGRARAYPARLEPGRAAARFSRRLRAHRLPRAQTDTSHPGA